MRVGGYVQWSTTCMAFLEGGEFWQHAMIPGRITSPYNTMQFNCSGIYSRSIPDTIESPMTSQLKNVTT